MCVGMTPNGKAHNNVRRRCSGPWNLAGDVPVCVWRWGEQCSVAAGVVSVGLCRVCFCDKHPVLWAHLSASKVCDGHRDLIPSVWNLELVSASTGVRDHTLCSVHTAEGTRLRRSPALLAAVLLAGT